MTGTPEAAAEQASTAKNNPPKKKGWGRRIVKGLIVSFFAVMAVGAAGFFYLYARAEVPSPDQFALAQTTTVYYQDGTTEMGTLSEIKRNIIDAQTLPDYVSKAVVASEDRSFYTNSGIDLKGIARALFTNITTGTRQGGSTLTQQYVERYYMGETLSYSGKLKEAILALKINREQTKDEILGNYLNTIYFGRGTYGIEAASQAYFGHSAAELTLSEAALLAGIIPAPSAWDPAVDPEQAQARWQRVLDLMVEDQWITQADADAAVFPETKDPDTMTSRTFAGPNGYLLQQVRAELIATGAFTDDQIDSGGLKIISTIDKEKQDAIVAAANTMTSVSGWDPATMYTAITSVNPQNGEIVAEYGGADYQTRQQNAATQDIAAAGSTFKVFTLLAHARQGGSMYDIVDGSSPMTVPGLAKPVANIYGVSYGKINLIKAMQNSVNTAFVDLNLEVGPEATMQAAIDAGIPEDTNGLDASALNTLGFAAPHNVDLAVAYSTVANGGSRVDAHIVREVLSSSGDKVYTTPVETVEAFTNEEVSTIMPALEAVTASGGTASQVASARLGVATAGKTGTSEEAKSALFVGFTPDLVTAVSQYGVDANGSPMALPSIGGRDGFHGGDWPADIWVSYMTAIKHTLTQTSFDWYVEPEVTQSESTTTEEPAQTEQPTTEQTTPSEQSQTEQTTQTETTTPTSPTTPTEPETPGSSQGDGSGSGTDSGTTGGTGGNSSGTDTSGTGTGG